MIDPVTNHKALAKHSEGAIDAETNHSTHTQHEQRWATVSINYATVLRRGAWRYKYQYVIGRHSVVSSRRRRKGCRPTGGVA